MLKFASIGEAPKECGLNPILVGAPEPAGYCLLPARCRDVVGENAGCSDEYFNRE